MHTVDIINDRDLLDKLKNEVRKTFTFQQLIVDEKTHLNETLQMLLSEEVMETVSSICDLTNEEYRKNPYKVISEASDKFIESISDEKKQIGIRDGLIDIFVVLCGGALCAIGRKEINIPMVFNGMVRGIILKPRVVSDAYTMEFYPDSLKEMFEALLEISNDSIEFNKSEWEDLGDNTYNEMDEHLMDSFSNVSFYILMVYLSIFKDKEQFINDLKTVNDSNMSKFININNCPTQTEEFIHQEMKAKGMAGKYDVITVSNEANGGNHSITFDFYMYVLTNTPCTDNNGKSYPKGKMVKLSNYIEAKLTYIKTL